MIADAQFARLAREAREHLADVQQLIAVLDRLAGGGGAVPPLDASWRPPAGVAARRGRPPGKAPRAPRTTTTADRDADRSFARLAPSAAIRALLESDGPLAGRDVFERLRARGWRTRDQGAASVVSTTLGYLKKTGALRVVHKGQGPSVFALASTPAGAARKVAAAVERVARVNGTAPRSKAPRARSKRSATAPRAKAEDATRAVPQSPAQRQHDERRAIATRSPRPPRVTRSKADAPLALPTLIVAELANSNGLDAHALAARLLANGWTTASKQPTQRLRVDLAKMSRGAASALVVDESAKPVVYRLRTQGAPSRRGLASPTLVSKDGKRTPLRSAPPPPASPVLPASETVN